MHSSFEMHGTKIEVDTFKWKWIAVSLKWSSDLEINEHTVERKKESVQGIHSSGLYCQPLPSKTIVNRSKFLLPAFSSHGFSVISLCLHRVRYAGCCAHAAHWEGGRGGSGLRNWSNPQHTMRFKPIGVWCVCNFDFLNVQEWGEGQNRGRLL